MAAGDYVAKGSVIDLGLQGLAFATYTLLRDATFEDTSEISPSLGEQGAPVQKTIKNPGKRIKMSGAINNATTASVLALKKGDILALSCTGAVSTYLSTGLKFMIEDRSVKLTPANDVILDVTLVREDSMAAVYDA